jgi:E3 ubiquitin-protein ligase RNF216
VHARTRRHSTKAPNDVIELTDSDFEDDIVKAIHQRTVSRVLSKGKIPAMAPEAGPSSSSSSSRPTATESPRSSGSGSSDGPALHPTAPTNHDWAQSPKDPLFVPWDEDDDWEDHPQHGQSQPAPRPRPQAPHPTPIIVDDIPDPTHPQPELYLDAYLSRILKIIPDVQPPHVLSLLKQHLPTHNAGVVDVVLYLLFETGRKLSRCWWAKSSLFNPISPLATVTYR